LISRYIVIVLAFVAASMRASQGAWVEAAGLACLGGGLIALKLGESRPAMKRVAYLAFILAAVTIGVVLIRRYS